MWYSCSSAILAVPSMPSSLADSARCTALLTGPVPPLPPLFHHGSCGESKLAPGECSELLSSRCDLRAKTLPAGVHAHL